MKILKNGAYYGQVHKELRTKDYILSEYDYNIPKTDWHFHEDPYFMYLLEGKVYDTNKKIEKRCVPGTLLFHNWEEQHCNSLHAKHARGFHLEIKRKSIQEFLGKGIKAEGSLMIENPNAHIILSKLYQEFHTQDAFSNIGIEALILNLLDRVEADVLKKSSTPKWLQLLTDLIYEDHEIKSLKELSQILGVHPVHISRTFSKHYGCTLSEYMRMVKIKKSVPYLLGKKQNLTEIAYLCGFTDQSHFSRTFKYYYGISPSKFRSTGILRC